VFGLDSQMNTARRELPFNPPRSFVHRPTLNIVSIYRERINTTRQLLPSSFVINALYFFGCRRERSSTRLSVVNSIITTMTTKTNVQDGLRGLRFITMVTVYCPINCPDSRSVGISRSDAERFFRRR